MTNEKLFLRYKNRLNNAQGLFFENAIKSACKKYCELGVACIDKTPEPFRVIEKTYKGLFKGRFVAHAQPDFQGTLNDGKSIIFEAKYTTTEKIKYDALTKTQIEVLERHYKFGAITGVCVGIRDRFFFVPWKFWRNMKKQIGRKFAFADDLLKYEVFYKYSTGIEFLKSLDNF